jgi:hypothetical protein
MRIVAIDPGPQESAIVRYDEGKIVQAMKLPNDLVLGYLRTNAIEENNALAIEMIASYGMAVGAEVFETVLWIGRYAEAWDSRANVPASLVYRLNVKMHLCHDSRAKDPNIRQALIDRFGPGKEKAIGSKRSPGPLYGVAGDVWSALAVAVTFADQEQTRMTA